MEDTTIEDVLKTVETLYQQKDYEKALKTLIASEGKLSPGIWHYNVGTVYGKLENLPMARFHLLMAEREGMSAKETIFNREIIESKLDVARLEKPLSPSDYFVSLSMKASEGILSTLSLVLIVFGLISFWKQKNMKLLSTFLCLSVLVIAFNFWVKAWEPAVVVEAQTIQEGPSAIFGSQGELPLGILILTKEKGEWLEIIYPSRFKGWIKDNGLKELK